MSENPLAITKLNDFIFCPASVYFHSLDEDTDKMMYQGEYQINGTNAHISSDTGSYSTRTNIKQAIPVFSERYDLFGKVDIFDSANGVLTERKKKIKRIYDGYIFQLYAQYFALTEMGYTVNAIRLHSLDDNKIYPIELPEKNAEYVKKFNKLLDEIHEFDPENFKQTNPEKCFNCIYEPLCVCSAYEEKL